jgi:UDPglucose 6-dehydrogenase
MFSDLGNDVWCVDIDEQKINNLKQGIIPIYEPGLENLVVRNYNNKNLKFTTSIKEALIDSNICFIAVGTPMGRMAARIFNMFWKLQNQ